MKPFMKEYEVEVIERKIVYVEATNEVEAIHAACREAISIKPKEINCTVMSGFAEPKMTPWNKNEAIYHSIHIQFR